MSIEDWDEDVEASFMSMEGCDPDDERRLNLPPETWRRLYIAGKECSANLSEMVQVFLETEKILAPISSLETLFILEEV